MGLDHRAEEAARSCTWMIPGRLLRRIIQEVKLIETKQKLESIKTGEVVPAACSMVRIRRGARQ